VALIAAAAQSVSALSLSSQCQATLASVVTSADAKCLNAQSLVGLVVASENSSVVSPINNWLTGMCSQGSCTNETLAAVVGNLTSGCSSELSSLGFSSSDSGELTSIVQMVYPTARKVACLADSSNSNSLCVTETLTNIQPYTGTLSLSNIGSIISEISGGSVPHLPNNVTCTNCTKAAYDIISQAYPEVVQGSANSTITSQCGASFVDGQEPASITQMANTAIASNPTSAASLGASVHPVVGIAFSSLLVVCSAFAILA